VTDRQGEALDWVDISRLLARYADVVNRRQWSELHALFRPQARVVVDRVTADPIVLSGPAAVGGFIGAAIERFGFFELAVLNARINVGAGGDPDRARGRVFITEIRQDREGAAWSHTYGVYHDTYRRVDDAWWFDDRAYQSLARTGADTAFAFPAGASLD
jgi:SnoaL-like domain